MKKLYILIFFSIYSNSYCNTGLTNQLIQAARNNDIQQVKQLIDSGVNLDNYSRFGEYVLTEACKYGHLEMVKFLLKYTNKINYIDNHSFIIVNSKVKVVQSNLKGGLTPLSAAVLSGNIELIRYLLSKGADINLKNKNGSTPVFFASAESTLEVMKLLIENNANLDIFNKDRYTPFTIALKFKNLENSRYLLKHHGVNKYSMNKAMTLACATGDIKIVKKLIKKGGEVNLVDDCKSSPLNEACLSGNIELVKYLVKKGANVNGPKELSAFPIAIAAGKGNLEITKYLIENDANINKKDSSGATALHWACLSKKNALNIIELLIENKAIINAKDNNSNTPLHSLCKFCNINGIYLLIKRGANPSIKNCYGKTPLDELAKGCGDNKLRKILTSHKIESNSQK